MVRLPDFSDPAFIEHMLGRAERQVELDSDLCQGATVLITGSGGFIGAELCQQVRLLHPRRIIAVENRELALVNLVKHWSAVRDDSTVQLTPELSDVRDEQRMRALFRKWSPTVVLHAAAYKHLSLLEGFPFEAMENNALASAGLMTLAEEFAVECFVLVSSDKAASPSSVLGASKHIAELLITSRAQGSARFAAMRCGNVLASPGSVLRIWMDELAAGQELSITDRRAERFFVSAGEAAAGLLAVALKTKGRGLFTYALTSPIRIETLAERFLEFRGLTDSRIGRGTGLRPGEKLKESLCGEDERIHVTGCDQILSVESSIGNSFDAEKATADIQRACDERNLARLMEVLLVAIPSYLQSEGLKA